MIFIGKRQQKISKRDPIQVGKYFLTLRKKYSKIFKISKRFKDHLRSLKKFLRKEGSGKWSIKVFKKKKIILIRQYRFKRNGKNQRSKMML